MTKLATSLAGGRRPELLAPVQDFTNLACALQAGCDAVYFGLQSFNMRSTARNFGLDDLPEISRRCQPSRGRSVKRYLTMNVAVFDGEVEAVEQMVAAAAGQVDGIICCDPAVMLACRRHVVPIHVSTQASVSNRAAAELYRSLGATRIVVARECTLEEIASLRRQVAVEIEAFAHGAMCVSYSGRCFLSQFTCGKSGNRGECRQNCRRRYRIIDATDEQNEFELEGQYVLSAKDLCTLPFVDQLMAAGIDALKIEGRNRNPQYVSTVVGCYRAAIDAVAEGRFDAALRQELVGRLRQVYNREFSAGFYHGRPIGEFSYVEGSVAEQQKQFVGVVVNHYRRIGVAEIAVQDNGFARGDWLAIEGPTTGLVEFEVGDFRQDEQPATVAGRGVATVPTPARVRANDRVFRVDRRLTFNNGR